MRKVLTMMAALLIISTTDASAQGFLKKLKKKAQAAVGLDNSKNEEKEEEQSSSNYSDEAADEKGGGPAVAQGSDFIPKRRTATVTWDGVITPSSATTADALMRELPALPSAMKMARSTMEEREAYTQKIAAVVTKAELLQAQSKDCSDEDMQKFRDQMDQKLADLFGLTKEEMAIMQDPNATEAQKKPLQEKMMAKITGGSDMSELERFGNMSEKEQEAYLRAHPEFIQKMQNIRANAMNFSNQAKKISGNSTQERMAKLMTDYTNFVMKEQNNSYEGIAARYQKKLQKYYDGICSTDNQTEIDNLYAQADELLYNYRLEAAREYRASLQRCISKAKEVVREQKEICDEFVKNGQMPACAMGRMDLNTVISVANLLDDAYKELPEPNAQPVCMETLYELKKGWNFCEWECGGYIGEVSIYKTAGSEWPLLAQNDDGGRAVVENGRMRNISDKELEQLNKQAEQRIKSKGGKKPPYGVFKSRNGKRTVEYSKTGELIVNGMTSFTPIAFTAATDKLQWIIIDENRIVKCTYKL